MDMPLSDSPRNRETHRDLVSAQGYCFSGSSEISMGHWGSELGSCAASVARCSDGGGSFPGASALHGVHLGQGLLGSVFPLIYF